MCWILDVGCWMPLEPMEQHARNLNLQLSLEKCEPLHFAKATGPFCGCVRCIFGDKGQCHQAVGATIKLNILFNGAVVCQTRRTTFLDAFLHGTGACPGTFDLIGKFITTT